MNMQRYWDLSERERAALSRDDVAHYVKIELMEAGVVAPPPIKLEDVPEVSVPKIAKFGVKSGRYGSTTVVFDTAEQAQKFLDLSPKTLEYDYGIGTDYQYAKPHDDGMIEQVNVYDFAAMTELRDTLSRRKRIKEQNAKKQADWNKAHQAAEEASESLWEDYNAVQSKKYDHERIIRTFRDYTETVGDEATALRFLLKAHPEGECREAFEWNEIPWPEREAMPAIA
jgi:hypothetical protein